ncbi:MAG: hypothetical protein WKG07_44115 [Hymenobacter sp.]
MLWNGAEHHACPRWARTTCRCCPSAPTTRVAVQAGPGRGALRQRGGGRGRACCTPTPTGGPAGAAAPQADAGSFGLRGGNVEARAATPAVAARVAASYREAQNNYPYLFREPAGAGAPHPGQTRPCATSGACSPDVALAPWARAGELTAAAVADRRRPRNSAGH